MEVGRVEEMEVGRLQGGSEEVSRLVGWGGAR